MKKQDSRDPNNESVIEDLSPPLPETIKGGPRAAAGGGGGNIIVFDIVDS